MKNLNSFILERLKLTKDSKLITYHFFPKDFDELRELVENLLNDRGKNANLNDIDVSNITDISELFYELDPYNIDISYWDVSNVNTMEGIFCDCNNFNCDLSKWDVSKVENMNGMFYGCKKFKGDGLENWKPIKCKYMRSMFSDCENLNCNLSKWDVSNVKDMICMFNGCTKFIGQGLENWKVSNVEDMQYMFDDCDSLKNIPSWYKE